MKYILLTLALVLMTATFSFGDGDVVTLSKVPHVTFNTYSGSTDGSMMLLPPGKKSIHMVGFSRTGGFKAMSGTAKVECSNSNAGGWVTCKDRGNVAVTTTANAVFTLDDSFTYLRFVWTQTGDRVYFFLTQ